MARDAPRRRSAASDAWLFDKHIVADVFDELSEGFILFDAEDRFVFCNETYRKLYDKIVDTLIPNTPFETIVRISAERGQFADQSSVETFVAKRMKLHEAASSVHEHYLYDGRWLRVTECRLQNGWILGTRTDITEAKRREQALQQSEQRLVDAIGALQEGFALFDAEDRLVVCNDRYKEYFPLIQDVIRPGASFEELIRRAAERGQNVEALNDAEKWITARLSAHARATGTFEHQFSNGKYLWVSERKTRDGCTLSTYVDITELKRRENDLRQAVLAAESANRTKSEFLAKMSHELRTPLNAVIGFSDTMRRELFGPLNNPRYQEYLEDIHASGKYLLDMINDLLDLAKIEAKQMVLSEEHVDLAEAVASCLRMVSHRAETGGIRLAGALTGENPTLLIDKNALKKILVNLLSNAVKFTPSGGSVDISCRYSETGEAIVSVADTGIGIKEEDIERIQQPFVQIASASNTGGTGLGLSITKSLAELSGGALRVQSVPGEGTTVSVTLPRHRVLQAAQRPRQIGQTRES